ncbi:hypothetical protein BGZ93_008920 [Podila epicladia]|nr:hypothetical protein BGZ92_009982 [Podila epicladia]KAG0091250.1 hypothetical protein BGZ93_008920 [Podila epicladia]
MIPSIRFILVTLFLAYVHAHSTSIITSSEHVHSVRHEILPRGPSEHDPLAKRNLATLADPDLITRDDTIRIQFTAYNTTFHLHLEPNHDLIHPDAELGPGITIGDIKAFKGVVVQDAYHSDRKWNRAASTTRAEKRTVEHMLYEDGVMGWARMMVEQDDHPNELILRGAFMVGGITYHITSTDHYRIQKRSSDALPYSSSSSSLGPSMTIFRDSDIYNRPTNLHKRGEEEDISCGADLFHPTTLNAFDAPSSGFEYYYPPNLTTTVPMTSYDPDAAWTDILKRHLVKRQVTINAVGPNPVPEGCPTNRLVNYMGVAADCTYVQLYGGPAAARKQIFANFNTASGIYESTFNVALGIIALNIVTEGCPAAPVKGEEWNQPCSTTYQIDQRLSDFSAWRGQSPRNSDGAGLWHLMTNCKSGAVVGIAWTKALCQMKSQSQDKGTGVQYTAGTGISSAGNALEWMVVAHEIGHGFGAMHDCSSKTCPLKKQGQCCPLSETECDAGARFIMNPSESSPTKLFSPCSIKTICATIKSSTGQCLKPPGTRTTQNSEANICGNGLKETGEECDCGSAEDCAKDPCCDGATCKYKAGAVCDDLNDSCCLNCQMRPAGQVCRRAISECDIEEVCTGTASACPDDVRVPNQTPCKGTSNTTGLECANGLCTSRDLQCQQQDMPGITKQCGSSSSCDLLCNDPGGSAMSCMQIPGIFFLDGTSCGFGGSCQDGKCSYSGGINGIIAWAKNHLAIAIPVASLAALIILCCIWSCCCAGCVDRRRKQQLGKPRRLNSNASRLNNPYGPAPVHGAQHTISPQYYPMEVIPQAPALPPPTYYDNVRHDQDMERALAESRRDYQRHSGSSFDGHGHGHGHGNGIYQHNNNSANNPFGDHASSQLYHTYPGNISTTNNRQQPSGYM